MRGKNKKRRNVQCQDADVSWINGDSFTSNGTTQLVESVDARELGRRGLVSGASLIVETSTLFGPLRPPSDLSLFNFAQPLSTSSRYLITRCKSLL